METTGNKLKTNHWPLRFFLAGAGPSEPLAALVCSIACSRMKMQTEKILFDNCKILEETKTMLLSRYK